MVVRSYCQHRLQLPIDAKIVDLIMALLHQRMYGKRIALQPGVSRFVHLGQVQFVPRLVCEHPDELIHLGMETLGLLKMLGHRISGDRKGQSICRGVGKE